MDVFDNQTEYWNNAATRKSFTHPIHRDVFEQWLPFSSRILDCGCGYGRTCAELKSWGFTEITGVDTSSEMIRHGLSLCPDLDLRHIKAGPLPFPDRSFDACLLLAVLTCIPSDQSQIELIREIHRILKPGGMLLLSDYPLQTDDRNIERYKQFHDRDNVFGVFRLSDGGVFRHHDMSWISSLLSSFNVINKENMDVATMNGNPAKVFQIMAQKQPSSQNLL